MALAAHDEVLSGAIASHGGWLFKHTGDGVCAAFESPRSPVAVQRALELPVRMGMATGEAERSLPPEIVSTSGGEGPLAL